MRWIVFDDETAELVTGKYKRGAAEIHYGEQPLDAALKAGHGSLIILPSAAPGKVVVARIELKTGKPLHKGHRAVVAQFTPLREITRDNSTAVNPPT